MELPKCCLPFFEGLRNCEKWESFRVLKIRVFSGKSHLTLSIQKVPYAPQNKKPPIAAFFVLRRMESAFSFYFYMTLK